MTIRYFAIVLAVVVATPATAATLVYDYGSSLTGQSLDKFDPMLGTLLSVTGEFTGSEIVAITTDATRGTVNYTGRGFYSVYVGPLYFDFQATGAGMFAGGNGPVNITLAGGVTDTRSDAQTLNVFTGTGTILGSPTVDPIRLTLSSGVLLTSQSLVQKLTSYKITYTYTPINAPVPEPTSWAMMITGFGAAGAALRRGKRQMAHA